MGMSATLTGSGTQESTTMSADTRYRIIKQHLKRPSWHEWVTLGQIERRTPTGRTTRSYGSTWLLFLCNNTDCNAEAVLAVDGLLDVLVGRGNP